jgi:chromosome partitioning protein
MSIVIAVAMDKGGNGKTTTAVALATGLHLQDKRTLLLDLDPQADATKHLGFQPRKLTKTINTALTELNIDPFSLIIRTDFGLALIPANKDLDATDRSMKATQVGLLEPIISALSTAYDYIVIDTRRSGSMLTIAALVVADSVLIPLEAEYLAADNLEETFNDIANVQRGLNKRLKIIGILPTKVRGSTRAGQDVLKEVRDNPRYAPYLLDIEIKNTIRHVEASGAGLPIQIYAEQIHEPEHATGYNQLVERVMNHA